MNQCWIKELGGVMRDIIVRKQFCAFLRVTLSETILLSVFRIAGNKFDVDIRLLFPCFELCRTKHGAYVRVPFFNI